MNSLRRFCFHPTPKDRLYMAIVNGSMTLMMLVCSFTMFRISYFGMGIFTAGLMLWNGFFYWANITFYNQWKKENKKSGESS